MPGESGQRTLVLVDRQGHETPIAAQPKPYGRVRFSPDGTRLVLDVRELDADIWTWDMRRELLTRITSSRSDERGAIWTKDARHLLYYSDAGGSSGIYRAAADGTGTPAVAFSLGPPGACRLSLLTADAPVVSTAIRHRALMK